MLQSLEETQAGKACIDKQTQARWPRTVLHKEDSLNGFLNGHEISTNSWHIKASTFISDVLVPISAMGSKWNPAQSLFTKPQMANYKTPTLAF